MPLLVGRRTLLIGTLALVAAGCRRTIPPRPEVPPKTLSVEFGRWNQEALDILSDSLETLRTFEVFQAFRVASTPDSGKRLASELAWDPPTSPAWNEATHVTRGLGGRADKLFQSIISARLDTSQWHDQRALADATHGLLDLGDLLLAYRNRLDVLPPGDASGALSLLDRCWAQWDTSAARFGRTRAEPISCGPA